LTERLYYDNPSLIEFDATVTAVENRGEQGVVSLDRTAFYPTTGGQNFDTGEIYAIANGSRVRVVDVQEQEQTGEVLHVVDCPPGWLRAGVPVKGEVDPVRRRDHMQQHSGQHVLSAAFERLFDFATVSFHMGDESCTIDLATDKLTAEQVTAAERLANEAIFEDRPVEVRYATPDEARAMGVRKIPPAVREKLRLIDIRDFDLNACGGTHVRSTGQIGGILLRKTEKVRQGVRVEFVCGLRAVGIARRDFQALTEAGSVFSSHLWDVPQQARKLLEEVKDGQKTQHKLLDGIAELVAGKVLREAEKQALDGGQLAVTLFFPERNLEFIKLLAQKLVHSAKVAALLACGGDQPSLVFAQTAGLANDMGALMKETVQKLGTRGGGNRDMAQGGAPDAVTAEQALGEAARKIG
jgi:alanyl-tRNA synthetase